MDTEFNDFKMSYLKQQLKNKTHIILNIIYNLLHYKQLNMNIRKFILLMLSTNFR